MTVTRPKTREDLSKGRRAPDPFAGDTYWARSMRPLHVMVFLLPLIALYEIGSVIYLTEPVAGVTQGIKAHKLLHDFFDLFGIAGYFLPGIAMIAVLLVWHVMIRDRWIIHGPTLLGMAAESVAWMLPLLVLAAAVSQAFSLGDPEGLAALAAGDARHGSVGQGLTVAIGAGLYEEMLFRLVGLALLHFILRDLIQAPENTATALAVLIQAIAFAAYHPATLAPGHWPLFAFYAASGVLLGTVYALRGFGIVVGAHAMYDVTVLVLLR